MTTMKKDYLLTRNDTELTLAEVKTAERKTSGKVFFYQINLSSCKCVSHDQITAPLYSVCFKLILSHHNHLTENSMIAEMITETHDVKHIQLLIATAADIYRFCAQPVTTERGRLQYHLIFS